jgi:hypothetical protein
MNGVKLFFIICVYWGKCDYNNVKGNNMKGKRVERNKEGRLGQYLIDRLIVGRLERRQSVGTVE